MSRRERMTFSGHDGGQLAGLLETPDDPPRGHALFAHCFTCGKDIASASRIARRLVAEGFAVLRFDFTGLGNSDGDFANTSFSSNVQDLVAAADHLRTHHAAPALLIGHSLGGTAVLGAAYAIPEAVGVVTIGAPADPEHVVRQFGCDIDTIRREGRAEVDLAGRKFTIRKEFLDDLEQQQQAERIAALRKALLIFHSPVDATVAIWNAEHIYKAARHPKSFISLVDADHLLSRREDADYVGGMVAAWAARYLT